MMNADSGISVKDRERMIQAAFKGRDNAYSNSYHPAFRVGAALLSTDGQVISGASVDGVSSGAICAERTAVVKAVSEGIVSFLAIAIVSDVKSPISPCGLCRQVLSEFCSPEMPCLLVPADYEQRREAGNQDGGIEVYKLGQLFTLHDYSGAK